MKPIAIIQNKKIFDHSTNWAYKWIEICDREGIPYEVVDGFNPEFINRCTMYSCVLWHFGNYVPVEMMETRNILYAVRKKGVPVFPDCYAFCQCELRFDGISPAHAAEPIAI